MCAFSANNSRYFSTLCLVLLALLIFADAHAQAQSKNVSKISAGETPVSFEARGLVRSSARIEFRTDLVAPVAKTPVLEGMAFSKDDLLIEFDCSKYIAELKAIKANANAAWIDHKSKTRLLRHGAIGKDEVNLAAANAVEASAQIDVQKARNKGCKLQAPFAGRVVELNISPMEFPNNERPLMIIINDSTLELEMVVPSNWLLWLKKGLSFNFAVDETGANVSGIISRMGAEVDPVSQTIKIIGEIERENPIGQGGFNVLAGMSGTASFEGGS